MHRWRLPGVFVVLFSFVAAIFAAPTTALGDTPTFDLQSADPPIQAVWARADGTVSPSDPKHAWLWGPVVLSETREPYQDAPGGSRKVFYFDKARMEITNPNADSSSPWYVTSGLLVREMISGAIQVGDDATIATDPAAVPVTGDVEKNPLSPTYATLAPLATVGADGDAHRATSRVGQPVTALLRVDGTVEPEAVSDGGVRLASYDEHLGHNIADVFTNWMTALPESWEYVTGYPLTEPYWVDTLVGGTQHRVLVQAFERRVLTYTPENPAGWQVEAGNAGLHYRVWRGLVAPSDAKLVPLASGLPLGELIVDRAQAHGIDPYLFAALAKISSGFNPLATMDNGGQGFFGLRLDPEQQAEVAHPLDPKVNADLAAARLAELHAQNSDWRAVLAAYYTGSDSPDWSDSALATFVSGVLDTQGQLIAAFTAPPKPAAAATESAPVAAAKSAPAPAPSPAASAPNLVDVGPAAFYSPSYSVEWWNNTLQHYASWGGAVPGWSLDPNGYYCVHPDFRPGQRLQLTANGVTLWCTIGDTVNVNHVASWRAKWAVELSYNTFQALHLDQNNVVEVRAP